MICGPCRDAADGTDLGPILACSVCGQGPVCVYNYEKPPEQQSVVKHKKPGTKVGDSDYWCLGSRRSPREQTGHDLCEHCPCRHQIPGSWNHMRPA